MSSIKSPLSFVLLCSLIGFAAFTLIALAAPTPAEAQRKILNIAAKEPETLDPHTSILGQSQAIYRFMYRGLTRFAIRDSKVTTSEVDPDLAESWTLSPDGTVWTFKLKKGVQFHKGFGEFTAESRQVVTGAFRASPRGRSGTRAQCAGVGGRSGS